MMADRVTSGGSRGSGGGGGSGGSGGGGGVSGGSSGGSSATRMQPSLAGFYDWSGSITGCVQVRQYHQADQQQLYYQHQHQLYFQQQQQPQLEQAAGASAQVFPVRRPSKATLTKMRQYYNPGMKLLQAGRPPDAAWREPGQLTKGERHLAMARQLPVRMALFDDPEPSVNPLPVAPRTLPTDGVGLCQCTYDPRIYPVYTSRSYGPMCIVCKQRRPGAGRHTLQPLNPHRDWTEEDADGEAAAASAEAGAADWARAPPSTPRPGAGRAEMVSALAADGRKATLDIFLPNAEREPTTPLPRPSCDSARSQRTLSSPVPLFP